MTPEGLSSWTQLSLLLPRYEDKPLKVSYRQSARLLRIAADLYEKFIMEPPPFNSAFADDPADPSPLLFHAADPDATADWLAARIIEIYRYNRDQLSSIASSCQLKRTSHNSTTSSHPDCWDTRSTRTPASGAKSSVRRPRLEFSM